MFPLLYGSGVFTLRTSSQATRFQLILAKQETENATVVDLRVLKIHFKHCLVRRKW